MAFDQKAIVISHGVLGSLAWVIFFPLGAILMSVLNGPSTWKIHAFVQIFAMLIFTAAVGTGLQMATRFRLLSNHHSIIGLLIFALMFLQALGGYIHHLLFKKYQRRTIVSYVHLWLGRILITLGIINGGLGMQLNHRVKRKDDIAYGVIAGLAWATWVVISIMYTVSTPKEMMKAPESTEKRGRMDAAESRYEARERRLSQRRNKEIMIHDATRGANRDGNSSGDSV